MKSPPLPPNAGKGEASLLPIEEGHINDLFNCMMENPLEAAFSKEDEQPPMEDDFIHELERKRKHLELDFGGRKFAKRSEIEHIQIDKICEEERSRKLDRIKDYLLMEEEFMANQERLKSQEDTNENSSNVDDLRGSSMSVGNLEEIKDYATLFLS